MKKIIMALVSVALVSCSSKYLEEMYAPVTDQEKELLANPPEGLLRRLEPQVPSLRAQVLQGEALAMQNGRKLTAFELQLARQVGVRNPEKIRIVVADRFPFEQTSIFSPGVIAAQTFRYGIFVKTNVHNNSTKYFEIITHEFAHVRQFEQEGLNPLVRRFLVESVILENKLIPIEREAIVRGESVYNDPDTTYGFGFLRLGKLR